VSERLPTYGGQAVIEGVMMRGLKACAVAVRTPDGEIVIRREPLGALYRSRLARLPLLRGLILLADALVLGTRALTFSANLQVPEEEHIKDGSLLLTLLLSLAGGIALFFMAPAGAAHYLQQWLNWPPFAGQVLEGLFRLALLVGYVWAIGLVSDIRRVYGYHAAEHMTINAFEHGAPLEIDQVARFPREHVRCGTAFLLIVVVFSVLLFALIGPLSLGTRLLSRVLLIPVLAMLAYEYLRLSARMARTPWLRPLLWPNLALQRLTTRAPDKAMIEVAIAAFKAMHAADQGDDPITQKQARATHP